jgi:hypothetical protein
MDSFLDSFRYRLKQFYDEYQADRYAAQCKPEREGEKGRSGDHGNFIGVPQGYTVLKAFPRKNNEESQAQQSCQAMEKSPPFPGKFVHEKIDAYVSPVNLPVGDGSGHSDKLEKVHRLCAHRQRPVKSLGSDDVNQRADHHAHEANDGDMLKPGAQPDGESFKPVQGYLSIKGILLILPGNRKVTPGENGDVRPPPGSIIKLRLGYRQIQVKRRSYMLLRFEGLPVSNTGLDKVDV